VSRPKAILYDAGGTLVTMDPARFGDIVEPIVGSRPTPEVMVEAHYRAMDAITRNSHLVAEGSATWWPWWLGQYLEYSGLNAHPDAVAELAISHELWRAPLPGALDGVRAVKNAGFQVAVVSNADGTVDKDLAAAGFGELLDIVIDSTLAGVSKPDPAIFTLALEALGVAPAEAWYVGDSALFDLQGARAAGLSNFVLVDPLGLADYEPRVASVRDLLELLEV
jgi:HAD superfamily hydrolase (TIGR01509 family)